MKTKLTAIISAICLFSIAEIAKSGDPSRLTAFFNNSGGDYYHSELNKLAWGQETNGVRVGLMPGDPHSNSLETKTVYIGIVLTNTTNTRLAFVLPEIPFQFNLTVFDEQGIMLSRTENGRVVGESLPEVESPYAFDKSGHQYDKSRDREFLSPHEFGLFTSVNLLDYYKITKPGKYRVEYEQRFQIAILQSNSVSWVGLVCPKATATIEVQSAISRKAEDLNSPRQP